MRGVEKIALPSHNAVGSFKKVARYEGTNKRKPEDGRSRVQTSSWLSQIYLRPKSEKVTLFSPLLNSVSSVTVACCIELEPR